MLKNLTLTLGVIFASGIINVLSATPLPPGPTVIPIDGGVSLLVAACAGYGAKKIYDARKDKSGK
jgi:ABC-type antimicrobial peptide transport system permease subunit